MPNNKQPIFSINSKTGNDIHFRVFDGNGNKLEDRDFNKPYGFMGGYPFSLEPSSDKYYFVEITSNGDSNIEYSFSLGGPNYNLDNYTYKPARPLQIHSANKTEVTAKYDLTKQYKPNGENLPDKAMVYELTFSGVKTGKISNENRYVNLPTNYSWTKTSPYVWRTEMSPSLNNNLKDILEVKLEGSSKDGFALYPELDLRYIYPVIPENVI